MKSAKLHPANGKGLALKLLAALAAAIALLVSATLGSAASATDRSRVIHSPSNRRLIVGRVPLQRLSTLAKSVTERSWAPSGDTNSDAPQAAASPTPTTTSVSQPDPAPILDNRDQVLGAVQRVHYNQVSTVEKPQVEKAILDQVGDASCKGPKVKVQVRAVDTLEATGATSNFKKNYIRIKKKVWERADSKHKWSLSKLTKNTKIGVVVSDLVTNPLPCPAGALFSPDASTHQNVTRKDLVNLGSEVLGGISVWHLQETLVDSTGATALVDYFVTQDHFLPVKTVITTTTSDGFNLVLAVSLSKFDVKVNITTPKTK